MNNLPTWELLAKKMTVQQLDFIHNMKVLDFGSGNGIMANYFAKHNKVTAVEPSEEMLKERVMENEYIQLVGSTEKLREMEDNTYDMILCHNVLEYVSDREEIVREFYRILKQGGQLSIIKHNRQGRVMQMVVLLNNFEEANALLDGKNSSAVKFGTIQYYDDEDLVRWCPKFRIEKTLGMRAFWDLQQNQKIQNQSEWQEKMLQIEMRVSDIKEYQNIAFFHHIILSK